MYAWGDIRWNINQSQLSAQKPQREGYEMEEINSQCLLNSFKKFGLHHPILLNEKTAKAMCSCPSLVCLSEKEELGC